MTSLVTITRGGRGSWDHRSSGSSWLASVRVSPVSTSCPRVTISVDVEDEVGSLTDLGVLRGPKLPLTDSTRSTETVRMY